MIFSRERNREKKKRTRNLLRFCGRSLFSHSNGSLRALLEVLEERACHHEIRPIAVRAHEMSKDFSVSVYFFPTDLQDGPTRFRVFDHLLMASHVSILFGHRNVLETFGALPHHNKSHLGRFFVAEGNEGESRVLEERSEGLSNGRRRRRRRRKKKNPN